MGVCTPENAGVGLVKANWGCTCGISDSVAGGGGGFGPENIISNELPDEAAAAGLRRGSPLNNIVCTF